MLNHGHSSEAGFTIVEAVVAGLILVIGILGSVSVFDSSRRESGTGERLQVAQARAEAELERMRDIPYDELATDSAQSWEASGDPGDPADRVSSGSAPTVQISAESDEELVLASGGAGISPYSSQEELAVEGVSYTMSVYRFVSWRDVECQVIELSGLRSQLNGTINALLTRAQSVNTRSGALITKYTGLLLTLLPIGGLKSELQALQTEVGELQAKLNALLGAVNDLSEIDPCDADIETLNEINDTLAVIGPALDTLDGALLERPGGERVHPHPAFLPVGHLHPLRDRQEPEQSVSRRGLDRTAGRRSDLARRGELGRPCAQYEAGDGGGRARPRRRVRAVQARLGDLDRCGSRCGGIGRMSRVREQGGYAIPAVLSVLVIVLGFGAVTVSVATHNVDRSERDRLSSRALQAADAGLDAAAYRMNKMILASKVENVLSASTVEALLAEAGCLNIGVGSTFTASLTTGDSCLPSDTEEIDSDVNDDGLGSSAGFRYFIKLRANVAGGSGSLIERQIIAVGEVDGVVQRVSGIYRFDVDAPLTSTTTRVYYTVCTAHDPEEGDDPAEGCPTP